MFSTVFKLWKSATDIFAQKFSEKVLRKLFFLKFVIDTINIISNWTSCHTIQGVIVLVISNWLRALRLSDFENYSLSCTPLGPITITYYYYYYYYYYCYNHNYYNFLKCDWCISCCILH